MMQGIPKQLDLITLDRMLPAPVRSLPLVPEGYRLTASPAGTIVATNEVAPAAKPSGSAPQDADAARLELHI